MKKKTPQKKMNEKKIANKINDFCITKAANLPSQARVVSSHSRSQIDLEKTITLLGKIIPS